MGLAKNILFTFGVTSLGSQASATCTPIESITCVPVSTTDDPPILDGNTEDWSNVEAVEAPLTKALVPSESYPWGDGTVKIRCVHDADRVYFLFEVPGIFRFSKVDNTLCASMSTMFRMGEEATLYNMGNCPLAEGTECDESPEGCDPYKVDLGGHWELKTTEMSKLYGVNEGSGDDLDANKDDEYAVSPYCRFDDDGDKAANEWEGAWLHTSPVEIERTAGDTTNNGSYVFEMARTLKTASTETDAQLEKGKAIDFGFAFWDPNELDGKGWTDAGHYVTGCSQDWISLSLVDENGKLVEEDVEEGGEASTEVKEGANTASTKSNVVYSFITPFVLACLLKNAIA